jgi:ketosteroid isomerase-like protein
MNKKNKYMNSDQEMTQNLNQEASLAQTRELLKDHVQAHYEADVKTAAISYVDDFIFYAPDNQSYNSRKAVEEAYIELYQLVEIKELEYNYEEFEIVGNKAIELGHYVLTIKPKGAQVDTLITSKERYLIIWEYNDEDGWKLTKGISVGYE